MDCTIIIPTYNEASNIVKLVPYLRRHGAQRMLVANSPRTTDETARAAVSAGAELLNCPQPGRAAQMNYAAANAASDWLYFVHADTFPPPTFLEDIAGVVEQGHDLGYFRYQFDDQRPLLRLNSYCTRFDGLFAGGGDQTLFIRRATFEALAGFREELCLMEDFDLVRRAKEAGYSHALVQKDAIVSARKYANNSWLRVNLTNLIVFGLFHCGVSTAQLNTWYRYFLGDQYTS